MTYRAMISIIAGRGQFFPPGSIVSLPEQDVERFLAEGWVEPVNDTAKEQPSVETEPPSGEARKPRKK
jgi:hypothetical protein